MSQFLDVFYEESFEGLEVMESGLLEMTPGEVDDDTINAIFRAAHSIKGGSGTFGLTAVADFTHVMETLLDQMRAGQREVSNAATDVLLRSVDCLREMLESCRDGGDLDSQRVSALQQELEAQLAGSSPEPGDESAAVADSAADTDSAAQAGVGAGWRIQFRPHRHLFSTGNDPLRLFRELRGLGELDVLANGDELRDLALIDPEECYLSWTLTLRGAVDEAELREVFEWVEDDCELRIEALSGLPAEAQPQPRSDQAAKADSQAGGAPSAAAAGSTGKAAGDAPEATAASAGNHPPKAVAAPAGADKSAPRAKTKAKESASIRVGTDKVDQLINLVGELVITQSMLGQIGEDFQMDKLEQLRDGLTQFERNTRELQESVMRIRMMPISFAFNRFPRMVRDVSGKLGKQVELTMSGEGTEVDKTVMEKIGDPLVHLVRNAVDHGIERPEDRRAAGKPECGSVHLNAYHRGGNIVIEIADDGAGLNRDKLISKAVDKGLLSAVEGARMSDEEAYGLIFRAGFSTADEVSDLSGRGVGMDVVRSNIRDLGGSVEIASEPGRGSSITIRLPLTLAILDGQTVAVGEETYIVPLVSIIESIQVTPEMVNMVAGRGETLKLRNQYLPIVRLHDVFGIESARATRLEEGLLVVVETQCGQRGLFIDELLGQQQVVIKSLEANYRRVDGISGATILGDGSVALILDIPDLVRLASQQTGQDTALRHSA